MRSAPFRRRSSALSFIAQTTTSKFNRPLTFAAAGRQVPFTDKTSLTNAITGMQAGDYIYYNGTSADLTISGTSADVFSITGKNPASWVAIDFGVATSYWGTALGTPTSSHHVIFNQTHTSSDGFDAFYMDSCSNIAIYGGEYTSTANGISIRGPMTSVSILDAWIHDVGESGMWVIPTTSGGAAATIQNMIIRAEVGPNWCMNPAIDNHNDKGTGQHCALLADSAKGGSFNNNTVAIYGHDSLQPGATSYGQTWPEGGGGSVIEIGQSTGVGSATIDGNVLYAYGKNNKMIPNGTNPGSTASQTAGNVYNLWGNVPMNLEIGWAEGNNITGAVVHGDASSGYHSVPITVDHGRHTNTNLSTAGSNISVPYQVITEVTYNDCT